MNRLKNVFSFACKIPKNCVFVCIAEFFRVGPKTAWLRIIIQVHWWVLVAFCYLHWFSLDLRQFQLFFQNFFETFFWIFSQTFRSKGTTMKSLNHLFFSDSWGPQLVRVRQGGSDPDWECFPEVQGDAPEEGRRQQDQPSTEPQADQRALGEPGGKVGLKNSIFYQIFLWDFNFYGADYYGKTL